jgi:hypothetical protein
VKQRVLLRTALLACLCCALPILVGCGGVSPLAAPVPSESLSGTGRATFTIRWPEASPTRLIPLAAKSIRLTLRDSAGALRKEQLLARPISENTSSVTLDSLPTGTLTVVASALPQTDGTGVVQATGTAPLVIQANKTSEITLTMESTIASLELLVSPSRVPVQTTATLAIVARDAAGSVVLTSPSKWSFTSSRPEIARIAASGDRLEALALGTTDVTANEIESGKSILATVHTIPNAEYGVVRINRPADAFLMNPAAVNTKGWVIGSMDYSNGDRLPFLWKLRADRSGGDFMPVAPYPGFRITYFQSLNDDGVVQGYATNNDGGENPSFQWKNGVYTRLPMIASLGINNSDQIVGYDFANGLNIPVIYTAGNLTQISAMIPGTAQAINDAGEVTGWTRSNGIINQGYRYKGGVATVLPLPSGFESFQADEINQGGTIMGWCIRGPGGIYTPGIAAGNSVTPLALLAGTNRGIGRNIADDNTVVGISYTQGTSENNNAVRWRDGRVERLADLVPPGTGAMYSAHDISDNGLILCDSGFTAYQFLLIPRDLY